MVSLVLKTSKPETLFDNIHEKGALFYTQEGDNFTVAYYATNRQIWFEGKITDPEQLAWLEKEGNKVKRIEYDKFSSELRIEE